MYDLYCQSPVRMYGFFRFILLIIRQCGLKTRHRIDAVRCHDEPYVEAAEFVMAPELPVGSDKRRIKAQMFQFRHVNRIQSELQHPLKDFVILMQGIDYPQLDITAIASHPVVVLVLAVLAAEFSVCPAILDLIPTFKTDCKLAVIFSFISHITASLVTSNVANGKENAKTMWRNTGNRPEFFLFLSDSQFFRTGQKKFMVHAGKRKKQKKRTAVSKKKNSGHQKQKKSTMPDRHMSDATDIFPYFASA